MTSIRLPYARITYSRPVITIVYDDKVDLGLFEIRELNELCSRLSNNTPYFVLNDAPGGVNITPQGKRALADITEAPLHCGTALVVHPKLVAISDSLFSGLKKLSCPFRVFSDKDEALMWLHGLRRQQLSLRDPAARYNASRRKWR